MLGYRESDPHPSSTIPSGRPVSKSSPSPSSKPPSGSSPMNPAILPQLAAASKPGSTVGMQRVVDETVPQFDQPLNSVHFKFEGKMQIFRTLDEYRRWRRALPSTETVAFFPTMGCLHEGHLVSSLIPLTAFHARIWPFCRAGKMCVRPLLCNRPRGVTRSSEDRKCLIASLGHFR